MIVSKIWLLIKYDDDDGSILELAVPVWHPGLTQLDVRKLERVQQCAFSIILGPVWGVIASMTEQESFSKAWQWRQESIWSITSGKCSAWKDFRFKY